MDVSVEFQLNDVHDPGDCAFADNDFPQNGVVFFLSVLFLMTSIVKADTEDHQATV